MAIDLEQEVLSSMVLGIDRADYGMPLSRLDETKTTVRENTLARFLNAVKGGDIAQLEATARTSRDGEQGAAPSARLLANLYSQTGGGDVFLRSEYHLSDEFSVLSWSPLGGEADVRLFIALGWQQDLAGLTWYPAGGPRPLGFVPPLLNRAEVAAARGLGAEVELEPEAYRYSSPVPGTDATLHFNGKAFRWGVQKDEAPPWDVLEYYREAYLAYLAEGPLALAEYYTEQSAADLRSWAGGFEEGQLQPYLDDLKRQSRMVVFVLDATPFYIVFYNTFSRGPGYDTILRDPETGELQLTAFRMSTDLDLMMRDEGHFWKPVISPIASRGPDANRQPSMPVVPSYLKTGRALAESESENSDRGGGERPSSMVAEQDADRGDGKSSDERSKGGVNLALWVAGPVLAAALVGWIAKQSKR